MAYVAGDLVEVVTIGETSGTPGTATKFAHSLGETPDYAHVSVVTTSVSNVPTDMKVTTMNASSVSVAAAVASAVGKVIVGKFHTLEKSA